MVGDVRERLGMICSLTPCAEEAALEKDPDSFDPSVALRDYEAIDLPVFTVSARDYVRLSGAFGVLLVLLHAADRSHRSNPRGRRARVLLAEGRHVYPLSASMVP
jgi:hypothetical protein